MKKYIVGILMVCAVSANAGLTQWKDLRYLEHALNCHRTEIYFNNDDCTVEIDATIEKLQDTLGCDDEYQNDEEGEE